MEVSSLWHNDPLVRDLVLLELPEGFITLSRCVDGVRGGDALPWVCGMWL